MPSRLLAGKIADLLGIEGDPSAAGGPDATLLATIPGDRIAYVQLSDAAPEPAGDLRMETMLARRLPGAGAVDFDEFIASLRATGARPFVAPEVFNPTLVRDLGPLGAALAARSATEEILARPERTGT